MEDSLVETRHQALGRGHSSRLAYSRAIMQGQSVCSLDLWSQWTDEGWVSTGIRTSIEKGRIWGIYAIQEGWVYQNGVYWTPFEFNSFINNSSD